MDAVVHTASGGTALLFDSPDIEPYVQLDGAYMSFGSASTKLDWNTEGAKGWSIMAYARAPPSSTALSERLFEFSGGGELVNAISFGRAGTSSSGEYVVYGPGGSSEVQLRIQVPDLWNNEWRLVTATTTNSSYTVLVDGELVVSGPTSALVGSRTTSLNYVGRSSAAAVPFAKGMQFRELKFWMVPLDTEDIDSLHQLAASQWGATVLDVPVMEQLREAARGASHPPPTVPPAAPQGSGVPLMQQPNEPTSGTPQPPRAMPPAAQQVSPPALALRAPQPQPQPQPAPQPQPQPQPAPQPAPQPQPQPAAMPPALSPPRLLPPVKSPPAANAPPVSTTKQTGKGLPQGQGTNTTAVPSSNTGESVPNSTSTASNSSSKAPSIANRAAGQGQQQQGTPAAGYVSGLYISPEIRASATYKVRPASGITDSAQCTEVAPS
jgi:hypothetical protein